MKKDNKTAELKKKINSVLKSIVPENLSDPMKRPDNNDHTGNAVQLIEWGYPQLAADHLLFPELNGSLVEVVSGILRKLSFRFALCEIDGGESGEELSDKIAFRFYAYQFLYELSANFIGLESRWLDEIEKDDSMDQIVETALSWELKELQENQEAIIAEAAADSILKGMELVQGGVSMVALTAKRIRKALKGKGPITCNYIDAIEEEITENIYFEMVASERCKFGNDYALGLRWLRHLGFEQVSTNPVLAAKAYDDDAGLSNLFVSEVVNHPKYETWKLNKEKYSDEITLYATLFALWDNLHVYRPIFYNLSDESGGGVVSFQLNPNIAHKAEESIKDALNVLRMAEEDLRVYDSYLTAGYDPSIEKARANLVIKVSASHPAARKIARTINSYGLGSNITVVYTVGQQVTMILEEMAGMASALCKGTIPTQLYMTNMGGRFESHLRESKLEADFEKLKKKIGEKGAMNKVVALAKANGSADDVKKASGYKEAYIAATRYKVQPVIDGNIIKALKDIASKSELEQWEDDLQKSGTLVARRVWGIFFSDKNREKWIDYLCENYKLEEWQAGLIMSRINYLPASKRRPKDTYWTLTANNMVHTEFGNHQENVRKMSLTDDFDLADYVESIRDSFEPEVTSRLYRLKDFVTGYELNKELIEILEYAGITCDFGSKGHTPAQWSKFGSVQKTLGEFKNAYDNFSDRVVKLFPE